ncbi:MAG TPA: DUF1697 domain-containing protein [Rhizomicrobium sp.]|nr:DUF1697 domain-containing protein [Rhizomicrobium sp.]
MLAVAFLRAVNVGGTGKLAMADLKALAEEIDLGEPRTLLQSGNLVFDAKGKAPAKLESLLESEIKKRFGIETAVMVRNGAALKAVIARNPFPEQAKSDPGFLHVYFLKDETTAKHVDALRAAIKGPEKVEGAGHEVFIFYPEGAGRSKLTSATIEKHLGARGTARNWNTINKAADMT